MLVGRVQFEPLRECQRCRDAVQHYSRHCIHCRANHLPDLLTPHGRGGRVYCAKCFIPEVDDYETVQRGQADGSIPKWVKRNPREMGMAAQWTEDWKQWHTHGLEWIVMSGRVSPGLFSEPNTGKGTRILAAFPRRDNNVAWSHHVAGYLLAGVGTEILLKGLYLKSGCSIRRPNGKKALAKLGTPEEKWFDPYHSASFAKLLSDENLGLICNDPTLYKPLTIAQWWRDDTAHTAVTGTGDEGVHLMKLGMALRALHDALLKKADEVHVREIQKILTVPVIPFRRK